MSIKNNSLRKPCLSDMALHFIDNSFINDECIHYFYEFLELDFDLFYDQFNAIWQ